MKKNRLIPVLLLKNGWLVQSKGFSRYQNLGNPVQAVKRLSEWASDELVYLDISDDENYDMRRDDQGYKNRQSFLEIIEDVSKATFMPITVGGRIRTMKEIEMRLSLGADKICINTKALENPKFISEAAKEFGSQCIVISMDVKLMENGKHKVFSSGGKNETEYSPVEWAKTVQDYGAGEIFLNSIDRDGAGIGYDIKLIQGVSNNTTVPVIACGGANEWEHFGEAFEKSNVDAVAAANIFHYIDQSVYLAKKHLYDNNFNVRKPDLINI